MRVRFTNLTQNVRRRPLRKVARAVAVMCRHRGKRKARLSFLFKKQSAMLMPHLQNRDDATCLVEAI
jgi:hypothetical protein